MAYNPIPHRQMLLTSLNQHGTSTIRQMMERVPLQKSAISRHMQYMVDTKEVSIERKLGNRAVTFYYTAEAKITKGFVLVTKEPVKDGPWRTVHRGTNGAHPIPNQGGQGACPPRKVGPMG